MLPVFSSPPLLHPIYGGEKSCPQEQLKFPGRCADWLFDFGQDSYELASLEGRLIACLVAASDRQRPHWIEIAIKIILIATVVIPVCALACKVIHRVVNNPIWTDRPELFFTAFNAASSIESQTLKEQALSYCRMMLLPDDFEKRVELVLSDFQFHAKNHELLKLSCQKALEKSERAFELIGLIEDPHVQRHASKMVLSLMLPHQQERAVAFIASVQNERYRAVLLALFAASIQSENGMRAREAAREGLSIIENEEDEFIRTDAYLEMIPFLFRVDAALGKEAVNEAYQEIKSKKRAFIKANALGRLGKTIKEPVAALQMVDRAVKAAEKEPLQEYREWTLKKLSEAALPISKEKTLDIIDKISSIYVKTLALVGAAASEDPDNKESALDLLNRAKLLIPSIRPEPLYAVFVSKMISKAAKVDPAWASEMMQTLPPATVKKSAAVAVISALALLNPGKALLLAKTADRQLRDDMLIGIVRKVADAAYFPKCKEGVL